MDKRGLKRSEGRSEEKILKRKEQKNQQSRTQNT